jgi:hypothetical protein
MLAKITVQEFGILKEKAVWFSCEWKNDILHLEHGYVIFKFNKFTKIVHCLLVSNFDKTAVNTNRFLNKFNWLLKQIR